MNREERSAAIKRAKRALKALTDHPDVNQRDRDAARDRLNECIRLGDLTRLWTAVEEIEDCAAVVYGVPGDDEPSPRAVGRWVSPRDGKGPAKPRRPRHVPRT